VDSNLMEISRIAERLLASQGGPFLMKYIFNYFVRQNELKAWTEILFICNFSYPTLWDGSTSSR
jgi:hypothetical protein